MSRLSSALDACTVIVPLDFTRRGGSTPYLYHLLNIIVGNDVCDESPDTGLTVPAGPSTWSFEQRCDLFPGRIVPWYSRIRLGPATTSR